MTLAILRLHLPTAMSTSLTGWHNIAAVYLVSSALPASIHSRHVPESNAVSELVEEADIIAVDALDKKDAISLIRKKLGNVTLVRTSLLGSQD